MARRSLLQESWAETREWLTSHTRATAYGATALVLTLLAVTIAATRDEGRERDTTVRADQTAVSVSTPTTLFGDDLVPNPNRPLTPTPSAAPGNAVRTTPSAPARGRTATTTGAGKGGPTTTGAGGPTTTALAPEAFGPNRIAFVSNGSTYTARPDGSDLRLIASNAFYPAWAPSHQALAVVDGQNPGGALSYVDPSGARRPLTTAPDASGEGDSRPTWSPDGLRLAFGRVDFQGVGGYSSIWVINKDGQNARQISVAGCFSADPTWSPIGTHIAFWSSRDHCTSGDIGSYELYVMRSDGTEVRKLGTATNSGAPVFSPDGSKIAFASDRDGDFEIFVMNADGSNQESITTFAGEDTDPTWSPDGSRIAFRSARNGGGVFTMKADGTDVRLVAPGAIHPSWS